MQKYPKSSKAANAILLPDPDRPVIIIIFEMVGFFSFTIIDNYGLKILFQIHFLLGAFFL